MIILADEYFGNSIVRWQFFFLYVIISVVFGKILSFIIKSYLKRITRRTTTKIDDVIVDMLEKPLIFLVMIGGFYLAYNQLILPENITGFLGSLTRILVTCAIGWFFVKVVDSLIEAYLVPVAKKSETQLDDLLIPIIRKLLRGSVIVMAFIMILSSLGYDVTSIIAGLGIGGLAFALAAKDTLSNLFGGLMILTEKPFKLGEKIQAAGIYGKVIEIGLRSTRLETDDGKYVTIPNSKISDSPIYNFKKLKFRLVSTNISISLDTSNARIQQLKKSLIKSIESNENIIAGRTIINSTDIGISSLTLEIQYLVKTNSTTFTNLVRDEVNLLIKSTVQKEKIELKKG